MDPVGSLISALPMRHLQEVRVEDDNWTGITDPVQRKRRQNRLQQRAWRRRQKLIKSQAQEGSGAYDSEEFGTSNQVGPVIPYEYTQASRNAQCATPIERKGPFLPPVIRYCHPGTNVYLVISPIYFPLSMDHKLITLAQFNALRAGLTNLAILTLNSDISLQCFPALSIEVLAHPSTSIPPSLIPTKLQSEIPHHDWVDAIPCPTMRDNLLLHQGSYDEEGLRQDLVGGLLGGYQDAEIRALLVWSDPWRPEGWEVSEGFAKKWGFLLKGCATLLNSTNKWRDLRGEESLVFEV